MISARSLAQRAVRVAYMAELANSMDLRLPHTCLGEGCGQCADQAMADEEAANVLLTRYAPDMAAIMTAGMPATMAALRDNLPAARRTLRALGGTSVRVVAWGPGWRDYPTIEVK